MQSVSGICVADNCVLLTVYEQMQGVGSVKSVFPFWIGGLINSNKKASWQTSKEAILAQAGGHKHRFREAE